MANYTYDVTQLNSTQQVSRRCKCELAIKTIWTKYCIQTRSPCTRPLWQLASCDVL